MNGTPTGLSREGFRFEHYINGQKMCELIDADERERRSEGLLAFQVARGSTHEGLF